MEKIIIELFSGSKTVSTFFETKGFKSFTVDNNPLLKPLLCSNIQDVKFNELPGNVSFIWASPDCRLFSRAAPQHHWQKTTFKYRQYYYFPNTPEAFNALEMLNSTIKILNFFPDIPFIIENPIGRIQHFQALKNIGHYRYSVNYADYGFEYSKETYLFSNVWLPFSTKKIASDKPGLRTINNRYQRSKVPVQLVETIYNYIF